MREMLKVRLREATASIHAPIEKVCAICEVGHSTEECPTVPTYKVKLQEQLNGIGGFKGNFDAPYENSYNPSWKNHPGFSYGQQHAALNPNSHVAPPPSPHFQQTPHMQGHMHAPPPRPYITPLWRNLEDTINQFIQS